MCRPSKKVVDGATGDELPANGEDETLEKEALQDQNSKKSSKVKEQRLKELDAKYSTQT
jgi:hypothetical protein